MFPAAGREVAHTTLSTPNPNPNPNLHPNPNPNPHPNPNPNPNPNPLPLQFKFYGDDFKCPTCGADKGSFVDNGVVEV